MNLTRKRQPAPTMPEQSVEVDQLEVAITNAKAALAEAEQADEELRRIAVESALGAEQPDGYGHDVRALAATLKQRRALVADLEAEKRRRRNDAHASKIAALRAEAADCSNRADALTAELRAAEQRALEELNRIKTARDEALGRVSALHGLAAALKRQHDRDAFN